MKPERISNTELQRKESINSSFLFRQEADQRDNDLHIWKEFKRGNRKAFDLIFQQYVRLLYAYGGKISKDIGLVEDCIQDLFVELWNKRESLSDTDSIKFYLLKSIRRRIIRRLTTDSKQLGEDIDSSSYDVEVEESIEFNIIQDQVISEQRQHLTNALTQLSKRQREAVYLRFYEKMSYEEIAVVMNLGMKSSYNIIGKAIDALRDILSR